MVDRAFLTPLLLLGIRQPIAGGSCSAESWLYLVQHIPWNRCIVEGTYVNTHALFPTLSLKNPDSPALLGN